MEPRYADWIARYVLGDTTGDCAAWTLQMQRVFPELRRVRGHVCPANAGALGTSLQPPEGYPHWWLVTAAGAIVDPTVAQFPWPVHYTPWQEGQPEPTGKCYECGAYCYGGKDFCSQAHAAQYAVAVMRMMR